MVNWSEHPEYLYLILSIQLGAGILSVYSSWHGLDLNPFFWVSTRLSGIITPSIGLQSGVIYVGFFFSSASSSIYKIIGEP